MNELEKEIECVEKKEQHPLAKSIINLFVRGLRANASALALLLVSVCAKWKLLLQRVRNRALSHARTHIVSAHGKHTTTNSQACDRLISFPCNMFDAIEILQPAR